MGFILIRLLYDNFPLLYSTLLYLATSISLFYLENPAADSFLDDDLSCPPSGSESGSDIEHLSSIPSHPSPELSCHSQCISPDPIEEPGLVCLSSG